mgnify:CR=1 FL=1
MQDPLPTQQQYTQFEESRGPLGGRGKLIIAITVLVMAVVYLAINAFQGATVFYFTVSELVEENIAVGEQVRVNGKLISTSFQRDQKGTTATFQLTDGKNTLPAVHEGILPELFFNEHSEIVLQGTYTKKGVFESQMVIVKCPSKYASAENDQTV